MAECTGLENRRGVTATGGSNPPLSACNSHLMREVILWNWLRVSLAPSEIFPDVRMVRNACAGCPTLPRVGDLIEPENADVKASALHGSDSHDNKTLPASVESGSITLRTTKLILES